MKEIEVKAKIENTEPALAKFRELGCEFGERTREIDQIFVPNEVSTLPTEIGVPVLRIREKGNKYIFTLKIRLRDELDKLEKETEVSDPSATKDIILKLGFKPIATVVKKRTKTNYKNWEICIDEVEGLGNFIEIEELVEEGDSEQIQNNLFEFLKSLGVKEEDRVFRGYDVLIYHQNKTKIA